MNNFINSIKFLNCDIKLDEPLRKHTTIKIGGLAAAFVVVKDAKILKQIWEYAKTYNVKICIIGNGSNLLVTDNKIDKVFIKLSDDNNDNDIKQLSETDFMFFAGVELHKICTYAAKNSLGGFEFAYGIPGRLGGAVYMNASAYDGQMSDVIKEITYLDKSGEEKTITANEADFGYRHSIFMQNEFCISKVVLSFKKGNKFEVKEKMKSFLQKRKQNHPLEFPSAGSIFKHPQGYFAGALIENCGLKGLCIGKAEVSKKHAGFIINRGEATYEDVITLIEIIKNKVNENYDVKLELEIKKI